MTFHLVAPHLGRVSGGLRYNHAVVAAAGPDLVRHVMNGSWPEPSESDISALQKLINDLGQGVLLDGLIGCSLPSPLTGSTPVVQLVHSLAVDPEAQRREGACLEAAHAVVTTSRFAAGELYRRYGIPAEVATPGTHLRPVAAGGNGRNFMCIGAIEDNKNQLFLATVLNRLYQRGVTGWHCTFAGPVTEPAYEKCLRKALTSLPPGSTVVSGELDDTALAELYHRADLLLLPSRTETFGMVVREAAAAAIPALVTAGTGSEEALVAGCALPLDERDWGQALYQWMNDDEHREAVRDQAHQERVDSLYNWADTAHTILETLKGVS